MCALGAVNAGAVPRCLSGQCHAMPCCAVLCCAAGRNMASFENFTEGGRVAALDKQVGQAQLAVNGAFVLLLLQCSSLAFISRG
jgi:hypothetical protein